MRSPSCFDVDRQQINEHNKETNDRLEKSLFYPDTLVRNTSSSAGVHAFAMSLVRRIKLYINPLMISKTHKLFDFVFKNGVDFVSKRVALLQSTKLTRSAY